MMNKQELRQYIRAQKKLHVTGELSPCEVLPQHPRIIDSRTILVYSALPDEVPTQALLDLLVKQGKTVLLPRVISDTDMELRCYTGRHDLQEGAYGILEPNGALFTDYDTIDVAIVPGMAFDTEGHRLGRGKGYYDRFLSSHFSPLTTHHSPLIIGICFPFQRVAEVPTEDYDVYMNEVYS